jgi:hypothetical protein
VTGWVSNCGERLWCRMLVVAVPATMCFMAGVSPAVAAAPQDGEKPGQGLSGISTLLIFVGAPLGLFAVITVLVLGLSSHRSHRPADYSQRPTD